MGAAMIDIDEIDPQLRPASLMRAALDPETVERYRECLKDLPPIRVMQDKAAGVFWLVDGRNRVEAFKAAGRKAIPFEWSEGTYQDAFREASQCNRTHGLPVTNKDKRARVEAALADPAFAEWSNRRIAKLCGVSLDMINRHRPHPDVNDSFAPPTRIDSLGRNQPATKPKGGGKPKPPIPGPQSDIDHEVNATLPRHEPLAGQAEMDLQEPEAEAEAEPPAPEKPKPGPDGVLAFGYSLGQHTYPVRDAIEGGFNACPRTLRQDYISDLQGFLVTLQGSIGDQPKEVSIAL